MCTEVHSYVILFSYWLCRKFEMATAQHFCILVCAVIFDVLVFTLYIVVLYLSFMTNVVDSMYYLIM